MRGCHDSDVGHDVVEDQILVASYRRFASQIPVAYCRASPPGMNRFVKTVTCGPSRMSCSELVHQTMLKHPPSDSVRVAKCA
jgi:hypothetical protein